ncbi:MAG: chitobiase/beta-hexosaminidase C-terminal domain-containing protein, partial [Paramuribaculum sp.]|nr:chitobiase/beta-hexosaminidase C-terminal domain-containing protein [Paramuribaculum sp.]
MTAAPQVSVPYIGQDTYLFTDSITVTLGCATPGAEIRYTLDGTAPTPDSPLYTEPLHIDRSLTIRAIG